MLLAAFLFSDAANAQTTNDVSASGGQSFQVIQDQPGGPSYLADEILIKFKPGANDQLVADVVRRAVITRAKHIQTPAMSDRGDIGITRVRTGLPAAQAVQALQNHPAVEYAQPNWVYQHQGGTTAPSTFDDTYFRNGSLWGVYDGFSTVTVNPYGSGAVDAWIAGFTGSSQVYVGVIDEGIQYDHPDLAANIWTNPGEIPGNGIDDDGNGYIDDVHGWNALNDNGNIYDPIYDDHGTHVAGTIGALGANGRGVAGINWDVSIISGKFLGPSGGTTADAIQAIDYMTKLKTAKRLDIVALNNSWGGGGSDPALLDSIKRAADAEILFVAAAGNGAVNTDRSPFYPACYNTTKAGATYDSVIAVTAIDRNGAKASWANYGNSTVDLGAPGVDIWSTLPGGGYGSFDGTSMATPHVTGAIALYASVYPDATALQIKQALLSSTTPTTSLASRTVTGGRLDVVKFLNTPSGTPVVPESLPGAPTDATATVVSSSQIDVSWTANAPINETGFKVERLDVLSLSKWSTIVGPGRTSYSDKGLLASTLYSYTITAYNALGESITSASIDPVQTDPAGPTPTAKFVSKDTTTKGNWKGRYGAGGYNVIGDRVNYPDGLTVTPDGQSFWVWAPFSTSTTDSRDLQSALIENARGAACWYSSGTFTVDLNFTDTSVHRVALYCLDWEAAMRAQTIDVLDPAYNTVLSSQSVSSFSGGQYLLWDITGHVTLRFTRTGGNNAVLSAIFFDTPPEPPAAPTGLTATAGSGQVSLSWTASTTATSYNVKRSTVTPRSFTTIATTTTTTYADKNVVGGTTYYYVVSAVNTGGESSNSSEVSATPTAPPSDFSITASPSSRTVTRPKSTTYTVTVTRSGGFNGTVTFSVSGLQSGASAKFTPASVTGSGTSTMTVTTTTSTSTGTKTLTITGASGSLSHSTTVSLTVASGGQGQN